MARRPFQSSASAVMNRPLLPSALSPWSRGTRDAADRTAAVYANHARPAPLPACERMPSPRVASTASADTKPTIASRPLIRSGAGPLNASASQNPSFFGAAAGAALALVSAAASAAGWEPFTSRGGGGGGATATPPRNPAGIWAARLARAPGAQKARELAEAITVVAIGKRTFVCTGTSGPVVFVRRREVLGFWLAISCDCDTRIGVVAACGFASAAVVLLCRAMAGGFYRGGGSEGGP
jgi:hypothetical protein